MSERDFLSEIRFSRGLGLGRAIALSVGVMLILSIFVLTGGNVSACLGADGWCRPGQISIKPHTVRPGNPTCDDTGRRL